VQIGFELTPANFPGEPVRVPTKTLTIHAGENRFSQEVMVRNPQLWWTWDLGPQNLYRLDATLSAGAGGRGTMAVSLLESAPLRGTKT